MEKEIRDQRIYEAALAFALQLKKSNNDKYTQLMLKLMGKMV